MKYLGIDYGTKRIGVAISDDTGTLAFPLTIVVARPDALAEIVEFAKKNGVQTIVLGESRNFKQEPNPVMEDIEQFKKNIEELSRLPVVYEQEFLTSAAARRLAQDKRGETIVEPDNIDASAAALILQSYLDRKRAVE